MNLLDSNENIERKEVKINIMTYSYSRQEGYALFFSPISVGNEILSIAFKDLCERLHIGSCQNLPYIKFREEPDITAAFCVLANRIFSTCRFIPGSSEECNVDFNSLKEELSKQVRGFSGLFIINIAGERSTYSENKQTKELELLTDLRNSIDFKNEYQERGCRNWQFNKLYNPDHTFYTQFCKYVLLNTYRYSLVVHSLIKCDKLSVNEFVPIYEKNKFVSQYIAESNDGFLKLFWAEPSSIFEKDVYPLDLALNGGNDDFLFLLLEKGASKFSPKYRSGNPMSVISDFICFMFKSANCPRHLELIEKFIESHSDYINNVTEIVIDYGSDGYSSSQRIRSYEGTQIIRSWYKCALRLQNIECLEKLYHDFRQQLLGWLNRINPYTGDSLSNEKEKPSIDMDLEINMYIQEEIVPHIKANKFRSTSYRDYGIWGFDARTGRPIRQNDLYV